MTPFGIKLRELRQEKKVTLSAMAKNIGVSPAYLSALEHGRKGRPSWYLLQRIITYFNIIWDEAEELVQIANNSRPKITIPTSRLSSEAIEIANKLADQFDSLNNEELTIISELLTKTEQRKKHKKTAVRSSNSE